MEKTDKTTKIEFLNFKLFLLLATLRRKKASEFSPFAFLCDSPCFRDGYGFPTLCNGDDKTAKSE